MNISKFQDLKEQGTNGINYEVTTDELISKLQSWDKLYGISIEEVSHDRLVVNFADLPGNVASLAEEVYQFCPDVVDQGFGCMDDMVEMAEQSGHGLPDDMLELIEGVDFSKNDFGVVLLQRSIEINKSVSLWWD